MSMRGAKPGDLPVQFPTKFEMAVNLKTAKALGLAVPPSILLRGRAQALRYGAAQAPLGAPWLGLGRSRGPAPPPSRSPASGIASSRSSGTTRENARQNGR
jgi:hypothetical protein